MANDPLDVLEALNRIESMISFVKIDLKHLDDKVDQVISLVTAQEGKIRVLEEDVTRNKKKSVGSRTTLMRQPRKQKKLSGVLVSEPIS